MPAMSPGTSPAFLNDPAVHDTARSSSAKERLASAVKTAGASGVFRAQADNGSVIFIEAFHAGCLMPTISNNIILPDAFAQTI